MRFDIVLPGKTKDSFLAEGIEEYRKRLRHYADIHLKFLKVNKVQGSEEVVKKKEAELLLSGLAPSSFAVALDAGGKQFSSPELAVQIGHWEKTGVRNVTFLLGGPLGLAPEVLSRADLKLSLSRMTFTHDMARLFLLEQLYRAYTIKNGGKYHK